MKTVKTIFADAKIKKILELHDNHYEYKACRDRIRGLYFSFNPKEKDIFKEVFLFQYRYSAIGSPEDAYKRFIDYYNLGTITLTEARIQVLRKKASDMTGKDLLDALLCVGSETSIRELTDILKLAREAEALLDDNNLNK